MTATTRLLDVFELPDHFLRVLTAAGLHTVGDVLTKARATSRTPGRTAVASVLWDASLFRIPFSECLTLAEILAPALVAEFEPVEGGVA